MRSRVVVISLAVIAAVCAAGAQGPPPEGGAKALFYDPVTGKVLAPGTKTKSPVTGKTSVKPVDPVGNREARFVGIHYWIELEGVGPVTEDIPFKTGDRIRLHVRSNVDGYLALWTLDPSGQGTILYPTGGSERGSPVKADSDYQPTGFIKFEPPPQEERLLVFFSRSRADLPLASKAPRFANEADVVAKTLGPDGARSLVFETEKKDPAEVGTYVVNQDGGAIVKEIKLKHQGK